MRPMRARGDLPSSVSSRRGKSARLSSTEDDNNSDFEEFGFDQQSFSEKSPDRETIAGDGSTKSNKTRLGKMMSKAANTLGSIATLSSRKQNNSATTDRSTISSSVITPTKPPFSTFGGMRSTPPKSETKKRPESLPLGRHSESLPTRPLSYKPASSLAAVASTATNPNTVRNIDLSGSSVKVTRNNLSLVGDSTVKKTQSSDEESTGKTWRDVKSSKRPNHSDSSDSDAGKHNSPCVVAHTFSTRPPAGYANPATVIPIAHIHSSTPSKSKSAVEQPKATSRSLSSSARAVAEDSANSTSTVNADACIEFPTVPTHPVNLSQSQSVLSGGNSSITVGVRGVDCAEAGDDDNNAGHSDRYSSPQRSANSLHSTAVLSSEVNNHPPVVALPVKVDANPLAIVRYLRLLVRFSPEPASSFFAQLEPTVNRWASAIHFLLLTVYIFLEILLELAIEVWTVLKPYRPELLLPSFAGLIMCFFGGSFVTTIAAAEAYRLVGYESTRECLKTLMEEFTQVLQAAEKDAELGIDDVEPSGESGKDYGGDHDPWSDWRTETETSRDSLTDPHAHKLYYSDGTELLSEIHHHASIPAQTYHLEEVLPTPKNRKASSNNSKNYFTTSVVSSKNNNSNTTPMATRTSARLNKGTSSSTATAAASTITPGATSTGKKLLRRRRSMFDAHSDGLEAFKTSVLEHRTPSKAPSSNNKNKTLGDSIGTETEQHGTQQTGGESLGLSLELPTPVRTPTRTPKRTSVAQSLQEYQKEQEELGADTTASKALFFLQNVDPQRFTSAIVGLNAGVVAVVATLKVQFAKTITLGSSLSKMMDGPAKIFLLPLVEMALPKKYKKWGDVLVTYSIRSFAISIAWTLRRVMSSFHSAIRGGLMFSKNLLDYLSDMGFISKDQSETFVPYADKVLGYGIALLGLWFQLSYGFALPFPLNVILFPFTLLEYALVWMVNNSHYIVGQYA